MIKKIIKGNKKEKAASIADAAFVFKQNKAFKRTGTV
jgi:glycyl-tRNA synthetase beta subunit